MDSKVWNFLNHGSWEVLIDGEFTLFSLDVVDNNVCVADARRLGKSAERAEIKKIIEPKNRWKDARVMDIAIIMLGQGYSQDFVIEQLKKIKNWRKFFCKWHDVIWRYKDKNVRLMDGLLFIDGRILEHPRQLRTVHGSFVTPFNKMTIRDARKNFKNVQVPSMGNILNWHRYQMFKFTTTNNRIMNFVKLLVQLGHSTDDVIRQLDSITNWTYFFNKNKIWLQKIEDSNNIKVENGLICIGSDVSPGMRRRVHPQALLRSTKAKKSTDNAKPSDITIEKIRELLNEANIPIAKVRSIRDSLTIQRTQSALFQIKEGDLRNHFVKASYLIGMELQWDFADSFSSIMELLWVYVNEQTALRDANNNKKKSTTRQQKIKKHEKNVEYAKSLCDTLSNEFSQSVDFMKDCFEKATHFNQPIVFNNEWLEYYLTSKKISRCRKDRIEKYTSSIDKKKLDALRRKIDASSLNNRKIDNVENPVLFKTLMVALQLIQEIKLRDKNIIPLLAIVYDYVCCSRKRTKGFRQNSRVLSASILLRRLSNRKSKHYKHFIIYMKKEYEKVKRRTRQLCFQNNYLALAHLKHMQGCEGVSKYFTEMRRFFKTAPFTTHLCADGYSIRYEYSIGVNAGVLLRPKYSKTTWILSYR